MMLVATGLDVETRSQRQIRQCRRRAEKGKGGHMSENGACRLEE